MYSNEIVGFLLRATIPKARTKYKDDLVWDSVWRAHRDVLSGRYQLTQYAALSKAKPINPVVIALYDHFVGDGPSKTLSSSALIECLYTEFGDKVEYAALLKLVNMSLKYLFILQSLNADDVVLQELPLIDLADCDCPLDSNIIKTLSKKNKAIPWTQIKEEAEYNAIQDEIRKRCSERFGTPSGLVYDLMEYPHIAIRKEIEQGKLS